MAHGIVHPASGVTPLATPASYKADVTASQREEQALAGRETLAAHGFNTLRHLHVTFTPKVASSVER